ncbi:MAG: dynamin family protein [Cyanobacteria bacterium P01_F01_bin.143]
MTTTINREQDNLNEADKFTADFDKATIIRQKTAEILETIAAILHKAESEGENTSGKLGLQQEIIDLGSVSENLRQGLFRLLVLGDMKRGKSTFLNAILGEKILPTGVNPCTAVLTIVRYGENKQVTIYFTEESGKSPESMDFNTFKERYTIPPDEAKKLQEEGIDAFPDVEQAIIEHPQDILKKGVELIDSPGLNDTEARNNLSLGYINNCQAILFVLSATQAVTQNERRYLENNIKDRGLTTFFLINRWDMIAQQLEDEDELPQAERDIRQVFQTNLMPYCEVDGKNIYDKRVFELSSLAAFKARKKKPTGSLSGTGFDKFFDTLSYFLTHERILAEMLNVKGLARQVYQKVHETIGIRIPLLDLGIEELKQKILQVEPEFEQLVEIRDEFQKEIRTKSEKYSFELADDFCDYLSNLDSSFETDFEPYQPDLKVFELLRGQKREEFKNNLEQAFNRYSNDKMAEWTKRAELQLKEAFFQLAQSAEKYGDAYSQVTDQISSKLSEQTIDSVEVDSDDKSPGWTRWAGAAAGIMMGNPAGAALVGFGALNWKSLIGQFLVAVGANVLLLYGAGSFLGPIGIGLVSAVAGGVQLRQAKKKLVKLAREEMKKKLPGIAKAEKMKVYNSIMEIFKNFEDGVIKRINSDILSRKTELDDLLAQKSSKEIDKTAEVARLHHLDSQILAQWNTVDATCDRLLVDTKV